MKANRLWPLLPPVALVGMTALFLTITGGLDNTKIQSPPECAVKKVTGFLCPGCGGTRCAQNILNGDWLSAFGFNQLIMSGFVLFIAFSAYLIIRITLLGMQPPRIPNIKGRWIWLGLTGIILFTVLRNIPGYPFSLLAP